MAEALRIGVDGRELVGKPTGVGRYLSALLDTWAKAEVPHHFTIFVPQAPTLEQVRSRDRFEWRVEPATAAGTLWEQTRLARAIRDSPLDVFFAAGYTAPLRLTLPLVVAIYDVSFFAHTDWFGWREGLRRRWLTRAAARQAHIIVTISEFSANEIVRYLDVPRGKIVLAPPGAPASALTGFGAAGSASALTGFGAAGSASALTGFGAAGSASALTGFGETGSAEPAEPVEPVEPVVLFVGSLFNRRRIPQLLEAFALVVRDVPGARLVLVGDNRTYPLIDPMQMARDLGIEPRVSWRHYVSDEELSALYASARVFAFLSDYEGFAMTPLEAIAHGVPPVLLDTAIAREVYGPAARLVSPEPATIAQALTTLLTDREAHARLLAAGRARLDLFSWTRSAGVVLAALERAARRS